MLRVGRVTRMLAGGCAVCHGGVWFLQGRQAHLTALRTAALRRPPRRRAARRNARHRGAGHPAPQSKHPRGTN